ncbi:MAG: N-acetylmuramoyl-L-alanine amidase [Chthoniobacteraceae bacterium]|nr:N-acetylmuramoyl-L-alanine amidase [Chthoniobacteraceae bacterium]
MKYLLLLALAGIAACASAFGAVPKTVVIDAGHGGHDRGGTPGNYACEKTLALDVAQRLCAILQQNDVKTVMTRCDDTFIPLGERVSIANAHRDALFVSIHFNSAVRRGADGFETYYFNGKAAGVAARVQANLTALHSGENRGVKRRPYYVLRKTRIPAILAECGFLTNREDAARCNQPAYRQKLAQAIASAVLKG